MTVTCELKLIMTEQLSIFMQWFRVGHLIKEIKVFNKIKISVNFATKAMF